MTKKSKDGSVGPWARDKLEALSQYLKFYTTALKNQKHWLHGITFVDAFAGPGSSPIRQKPKSASVPDLFEAGAAVDEAQVEFLNGSPRVALDLANPFSSYVFIELDPNRIRELHELQKDYGSKRNIAIYEGDANEGVKAWLASGIDWKHHRAVVFLDPFGMQVPWSTIERLAATRGIEIVINFPLHMAVQRLLTRSGEIPAEWQAALDEFFGSQDWRKLAYEETKDLLGEKTVKASDSGIRLLEWYRARLKSIFGNVSTARVIKNTKGTSLYYLIWAGPHKLGMEGAEHVLSKGERVGGNRKKKA